MKILSENKIISANVSGGLLTAVAILAAAVSAVALIVLLAPAALPALGFLSGVALIVGCSTGGGALLMSATALFSFIMARRWKEEAQVATIPAQPIVVIPIPPVPKAPIVTANVPLVKPSCTSDEDWAVLEPLLKKATPGQPQKFSRKQHNIAYSYVITGQGEFFRCTHKKKKWAANITHEIVGKGSFKVATSLFDHNNRDTFIRCSVKELRSSNTSANQRAFKLFGHLPNFMAPEPHSYTNPVGEARLAYYTPKSVTLEQMMAGKFITRNEKKEILLQIAAAVKIIHESNCAHRDIKPANIYLKRTEGKWKVRVADFDFLLEQQDGQIAIAGTPRYLPRRFNPEYGAKSYSFKEAQYSDLYAIGVIAHELFPGEDLFKSTKIDTIDDLIREIKKFNHTSNG